VHVVPSTHRWRVVALVVLVGACRGRSPSVRPAAAIRWGSSPGAPEAAALLLLGTDGVARVGCVPGPGRARQRLPSLPLQRILDVGGYGGVTIAAHAASTTDAGVSAEDVMVLLSPGAAPRRLAAGVRGARFSPDGAAIAYEVVARRADGSGTAPATSYVYDLSTGRTTELGSVVDPLWEADGQHLRATRLLPGTSDHGTSYAHATSLRVRWDRTSGGVSVEGRGSAQIPAPLGEAVAWSAAQRGDRAPDQCSVFLRPQGGVRHSTVGAFCVGIADERGVRWSPDGRWLAFLHPGLPGHLPRERGQFFLDIVGVEGGRSPALSALYAKTADERATSVAGGSLWIDWSPSGRLLAMSDGADDVRVYDFETPGMILWGKGQRPMWSPGGAYLLLMLQPDLAGEKHVATQSHRLGESPTQSAFVLHGPAPTERMDLGVVREARWLPVAMCPVDESTLDRR
jgi:hypothetical protein